MSSIARVDSPRFTSPTISTSPAARTVFYNWIAGGFLPRYGRMPALPYRTPWNKAGIMFERYTEKARRVIFFAHYEASQFGSPCIETEHLLLGLMREDKQLAARFLRSSASVEP